MKKNKKMKRMMLKMRMMMMMIMQKKNQMITTSDSCMIYAVEACRNELFCNVDTVMYMMTISFRFQQTTTTIYLK